MNLRQQARFLLPFLLILFGAAWFALHVTEQLTLRWFLRDLALRGALVANAQSDTISKVLSNQQWPRIHALFERTVRDERLSAMGLCTMEGKLLHRTADFPPWLSCIKAHELQAANAHEIQLSKGDAILGIFPVSVEQENIAELILLHDISFIERRSRLSQQYLLIFMLVLSGTMILLVILISQRNLRRWNAAINALLSPHGENSNALPAELSPYMDDLRKRLRDLEDHSRRHSSGEAGWSAERLRELLQSQFHGDELIVVSNREPWSHDRINGEVLLRRPASGLVTALEPVLRACSGTWIAHGSGNADREFVDAHDRLKLPPGKADYQLRRIWLSPEEVRGYYDGLSNEGLWPLCHMVHVRPVFREQDWLQYQAVNQRFADAVLAEARSHNPVVLVQDYQLALAPAMIRRHLPNATILSFWHIPWPTPEAFAICPWRHEILQGLLGATIIGFQTRHHQQNFLATVDNVLEARLERERSSVFFAGRETLVDSYPISIAWPEPTELKARRPEQDAPNSALIIGIDRFDYTKGIEERLQAFTCLLEKYPEWQGRLRLLQLAVPTRSELTNYVQLRERVSQQVAQINQRFGSASFQPVSLVVEQRDQAAIRQLYLSAHVCLVSSLHDGMNLVAKEFVAARDDEQGVLVLSSFTGAARELSEALIVNPYHSEALADTLHQALTMRPAEQQERMSSLRAKVREANVFLWAGRMLNDAARWRLHERMQERLKRLRSAS